MYKITDEEYPNNPNVTEAECGPLVSDYMCIYGYNINLERSFQMISDGLKPVMRRILYLAYKGLPFCHQGLLHTRSRYY